jgi:hypothetical protein
MDQSERRMTQRVTSEWVALKRQKPLPSIDFLHPKTFSVDWGNCVLIRSLMDTACPPIDALEFEFIGKNFKADAPGLSHGARLSAVSSDSLLSLSVPTLPMLYDKRTAIIHSGVLPWRGINAVYFRSIAVPFSNSAGDLTYALGVLSHKLKKTILRADQARTEFREFRDGAWIPIGQDPEQALATG